MAAYPEIPDGTPFSSLFAAAGTTAAALTPTIPGVSGKTLYVTGFDLTGGGASAGSLIVVTFSGLAGTSPSIPVGVAAGVTLPVAMVSKRFPQPLPGATVGGSVGITVPTFGTGNVLANVVLYGFAA